MAAGGDTTGVAVLVAVVMWQASSRVAGAVRVAAGSTMAVVPAPVAAPAASIGPPSAVGGAAPVTRNTVAAARAAPFGDRQV
ncbi:hypothetical protein ACFQHO_44785 [Actinomadura yumaensis]|uniref:hypothetical protein n=1 Tax=Actinomadura yumaensis TaxID=111807 RepID=UPI0036142FC2